MGQITINEALAWQKVLKQRHQELVQLRNENSATSRRYIGAHADKEIEKTPTYDVKVLDRLVTKLAGDMRKLDAALKKTNVMTNVLDYEQDESVLGEIG